MSDMRRDLPAWGISLLLNGAVLLSCHFVAWSVTTDKPSTEVVDVMDEVLETEGLHLDAIANDQAGVDGEHLSMSGSAAAFAGVDSSSPGSRPGGIQNEVADDVNPDNVQISEPSISMPSNPNFTEMVTGNEPGTGVVDKIGGGATGVMDRLTFEIRQSVKERQTLVIWAFDASTSMKERRDELVKRFETVYKQLDQEKATGGLYTAVVSYGEKVNILTPEPVQDIRPLVELVQKIPNDESGKEVVFEAVGTAVEKWRTFRKNDGQWNKLVFVITDERGDDAEKNLESVIASCKRAKTRVYTVGNASVFGQQQGFVRYVYEDGFEEYLPVDQGPESAYPEGLQLPSWGEGNDWRLNLMSASYGPYGLTRLCAESGGMYLISAEGRGQTFDKEIMRNYAPDYRPMRQAGEDIQKNAAKKALVETAQLTYNQKNGIRSLPIPEMAFAAYNDNVLRTAIIEAQKPVAVVDNEVKRLLSGLEAVEKDRDKIREPRWRAAYDLAMGRLLALRARYFGYNNMLAAMRSSPKTFTGKDNNEWRLVPSSQVDSIDVKKIAEKSKKYLQRVVDEHTGTPWAMLAERELRLDMGWTWQESSLPVPPGMDARGLDDAEVAMLLLAKEEEVKKAPAGKPVPPRIRPKL